MSALRRKDAHEAGTNPRAGRRGEPCGAGQLTGGKNKRVTTPVLVDRSRNRKMIRP